MADDIPDFEAVAPTSAQAPAFSVQDEGPSGSATTYHSVRTHGFSDMLLRPELIKAISDASFEHPSQVQHDSLPAAILGQDLLCQAKAGMGKTAVFVLAVLQRLLQADPVPPEDDKPKVLVVCHTHEMALQIKREFERFSTYIPFLKDRIMKIHGGSPRAKDIEEFKRMKPVILVGCPGRLHDLAIIQGQTMNESRQPKVIDLSQVFVFVVDECDRLLETTDSRERIQQLFMETPRTKQTILATATLPEKALKIAKAFLKPTAKLVAVDQERKLTLHGLAQHFIRVEERHKIRILFKLLDKETGFNQVIVFTNHGDAAKTLAKLMNENCYPTLCIHGGQPSTERQETYDRFKRNEMRFLVATDLFGRGVDVQSVNLVVNFDCAADLEKRGECVSKGADQYLHRVGRAGRFGTKGVAVTFVASPEDEAMMAAVQAKFEVKIYEAKEADLGSLTACLAATADAPEA